MVDMKTYHKRRWKKRFSRYTGRPELTRAREQAYLTQEIMANLLGVARATYATYETGTRTPTLFNAARMSEILKTPVNELFPEFFKGAPTLNGQTKGL